MVCGQVIFLNFCIHSLPPHPLHHAEAYACAFAQADEWWQGGVGLEQEGEGEQVLAFVFEEFGFVDFADVDFEALFEAPLEAFGEGEDVACQDAFQQAGLGREVAFELAVALVVFLVQGQPVEEAVGAQGVPEAERMPVGAHVFDLHVGYGMADGQAQVFVLEEVVYFVYAFFQADDGGFLPGDLVLDAGVTIDVPLVVAVVVEPVAGAAGLLYDGSSKAGNLIGEEVMVEPNVEVFDSGHRNEALCGALFSKGVCEIICWVKPAYSILRCGPLAVAVNILLVVFSPAFFAVRNRGEGQESLRFRDNILLFC